MARFICDIYRPDGTPHDRSARYLLNKTAEKAEAEKAAAEKDGAEKTATEQAEAISESESGNSGNSNKEK